MSKIGSFKFYSLFILTVNVECKTQELINLAFLFLLIITRVNLTFSSYEIELKLHKFTQIYTITQIRLHKLYKSNLPCEIAHN